MASTAATQTPASSRDARWTQLALAAAAGVGMAGVWWWRSQSRAHRGKQLPTPEGGGGLWGHIPFVGKLINPGDHIDKAIDLIIKQHPHIGRFFGLNFVVIQFAAVTDPAVALEVMVKQNLPKSPTYSSLYPFIGRKSMIVAHGPTWSRLRKAFTPAFTTQYLKSLVPLFVDCCLDLVPSLEKAAENQSVVLIHNELTLLAMDIITKAFMSLDLGYLSSDGPPEVFHAFTELFEKTAAMAERPHMIILGYLPWNWIRFQRLQHRFDSCLVPEIRRRLKETEADAAARCAKHGGRVDMFTMAMEAVRAEGTTLSLEDVLAQVKTFLFAGHDTTSSTVAFAIYELSRTPHAQAKLLEEVDRVCQGQLPTADHMQQLKYTNAIIKETLRLWPVGGTARMGPKGTQVNGYECGKAVLYVPFIHIHRDPAIWGPTAGDFVPERWFDEAFVASLHPCAYMPFSKGARDCIGQTFAMMEGKAMLALFYQRFTFEYAGEVPEEQGSHITSYPKHHVPVRVHRRVGAVAVAAGKS